MTPSTKFLRTTNHPNGAPRIFSTDAETTVKAVPETTVVHMLDPKRPMSIHDIIYDCAVYNRQEQGALDFAPFPTGLPEVERALAILAANGMVAKIDDAS